MADLLPSLLTLKGSRRVKWRRDTERGGTFKFLTDAQIAREDGRILLRFSNGIANLGPGPLEVGADAARIRKRGRRPAPAYQRIRQTDGPPRKVFVGRMVFDPDPDHQHWHFAGIAEYRLYDSSGLIRRSKKQAFCLLDFDRLRRGAPREYKGCRPTRMGISPGWADTYTWDLHGQQIDITNISSGIYRLVSITNPSRRVQVRGSVRPQAVVKLRIDKTTDTVTILR